MPTLLVKNAAILITMDDQHSTIKNGAILVQDNIIKQIGKTEDLPSEADQVIDAGGMAVMPGLINTHHHFFQTMFRAVPGTQDHKLFEWLERLFPIYNEVTYEALSIAAQTAMAEMILSGCTTSSDHHYMYSSGAAIDAEVEAAKQIGMRFHAMRGAMSLGVSRRGLAPDYAVQDEDVIIKDCRRLIETYHDPDPMAMIRIGLAPCTPFLVSKDLMRQAAQMARSYKNVLLHTHVGETMDEVEYCLREFNQRPAEYMVETGWVGPDVWWAHTIFVNPSEIKLLASTQTGVAHCPSSNMRLGSGICPVRQMLDAGVKVGIGVDGSASNDTSHVLNEARTAVLLQRVKNGADAFKVLEGLEIATRGGASVLNRENEIGTLEVGKAADFIGIKLDTLNMAGGAVHDPVAALLLCRVDTVNLSVINGKVVVMDGNLLTIDVKSLVKRHNELAKEMVSRHIQQ